MSEPQSTETVTVYADYVCPFCYLGYAAFDQYREDRKARDASGALETDWHPFDLRASKRRPDGTIDHSVDDGKDESYFEEAKKNVRRLADRYDAEMTQELVTDVDSYDAQRVAFRAREDHPEAFETFHRGVFAALWEDGRDIGDSDVLEDIATEAGVPSGYVDSVLDDESSEVELESAFEAAQQRGITGVPTFVAGEHAARGAVPPEQLKRLVEGV